MAYRDLRTERAYHRKRRVRLIAAGLCICCGKVAPIEGRRRCLRCQEIARRSAREYLARQRKGWKACGICVQCGQRQSMPFRCWCAVCSEASTERKARKAAQRVAA